MGARGEGWVIGQTIIGLAIILAPIFSRVEVPLPVRLLGLALVVVGVVILLVAGVTLGTNLTPYPKPKPDGHSLITTGIYGIVRHPIYTAVTLGGLGWSLWWGSLLGIALTIALFIWFDQKARREEAWLVEKYPDYPAYRTRVKKLIPFLY